MNASLSMSATWAKTGSSTAVSLRSMADVLVGFAIWAYLVRETFVGPARYYLFAKKLDIIWFLPDVLAILFMLIFISNAVLRIEKGAPAKIFAATIIVGGITGYGISESFEAVLSGLKLFCPLFVGFLIGPKFFESRLTRVCLFVLFACATVGIYESSVRTFPWANQEIVAFDHIHLAAQQRYFGHESRVFGFSVDDTAAAFSCLILYVVLTACCGRWFELLFFLPTLVAVVLTTSRTALGVLLLFEIWRLCEPLGRLTSLFSAKQLWSWLVRLSPAAILVPLLLSMLASAYGYVYNEDNFLSSIIDRAFNTWVEPFRNLFVLVPTSILTGYGIGAIGAPMQYSDRLQSYYPFSYVDNFIMFNFFMFGPLSLLAPIFAPRSLIQEANRLKMMLYVLLTLYGITVLGYGDGLFVLFFGYSVSGFFYSRREMRGQGETGRSLRPSPTRIRTPARPEPLLT